MKHGKKLVGKTIYKEKYLVIFLVHMPIQNLKTILKIIWKKSIFNIWFSGTLMENGYSTDKKKVPTNYK